jgi:tripartite-type tricarboxylate transporter receptor subunit TctC
LRRTDSPVAKCQTHSLNRGLSTWRWHRLQVPLQEALKQQFVVDYKPGASGMLAATELTRAAPDGYTLLLANTGPFAIAPYLSQKQAYDPVRQFTYIGQISQGAYIVATRVDHPTKDLK